MAGDRPLTPHEIRILITQRTQELDALAILRDIWLQEGKPTLHDLAIMELLGKFEAWSEVFKEYCTRTDALLDLFREQDKKLRILNDQINDLERRLSIREDRMPISA